MANKKSICLIPARYDASRFDGKLMKQLVDKKNNRVKSVIRETYERMSSYGLFDEVYVVTNSEIIRDEIEKNGGKTFFSKQYNHASGTDRIAEAARQLEGDIIFNVQGDSSTNSPIRLVGMNEKFTCTCLSGVAGFKGLFGIGQVISIEHQVPIMLEVVFVIDPCLIATCGGYAVLY